MCTASSHAVFHIIIDTGRAMARYCVAFESMKMFLSLKGSETLADLVRWKHNFLYIYVCINYTPGGRKYYSYMTCVYTHVPVGQGVVPVQGIWRRALENKREKSPQHSQQGQKQTHHQVVPWVEWTLCLYSCSMCVHNSTQPCSYVHLPQVSNGWENEVYWHESELVIASV